MTNRFHCHHGNGKRKYLNLTMLIVTNIFNFSSWLWLIEMFGFRYNITFAILWPPIHRPGIRDRGPGGWTKSSLWMFFMWCEIWTWSQVSSLGWPKTSHECLGKFYLLSKLLFKGKELFTFIMNVCGEHSEICHKSCYN